MADIKYVTAEGLQALKDELKELKSKGRADMAKQIAEARDKGDLSENAEYDAAKEAQGHLEKRIAELENTVATSRVMDTSKLDASKVQILSNVRVMHVKVRKEITYQIVSDAEADVRSGRISIESPIGKGLLGKKPGERVSIDVPAGVIELEIIEISF